jgi:predicted RNase H-like HicB family nuclease
VTIEVRLDHDGEAWGAFAESPELLGIVTATGNSREAVIAQMEDAIRFHLLGLREDGRDVHRIHQIAIREIVETRELSAA